LSAATTSTLNVELWVTFTTSAKVTEPTPVALHLFSAVQDVVMLPRQREVPGRCLAAVISSWWVLFFCETSADLLTHVVWSPQSILSHNDATVPVFELPLSNEIFTFVPVTTPSAFFHPDPPEITIALK
jgi:hypothetical protein